MPPAQSHGARPRADRARVVRHPDAHPPDLPRDRPHWFAARPTRWLPSPRRCRVEYVRDPGWSRPIGQAGCGRSPSPPRHRRGTARASARPTEEARVRKHIVLEDHSPVGVRERPIQSRHQPPIAAEVRRPKIPVSTAHGQSISSRACRADLQASCISRDGFASGAIRDREDSRRTDLPEHGHEFPDPVGSVEEHHDDRRLESLAHRDSISSRATDPTTSIRSSRPLGRSTHWRRCCKAPRASAGAANGARWCRSCGSTTAAASWIIDAARPDREMCS